MASSYHLPPNPVLSSSRPHSVPLAGSNSLRPSLLNSHAYNPTKKFHVNSNGTWRKKQKHQVSRAKVRAGETGREDKDEGETISKSTLIWRAIKLPIYSVALVPLSVGCAAAYMQAGVISASRFSVILVSSILIIAWLNLSNDVYDFDTGADKNKKESVVNLVDSRTGTLVAAYILLAVGFTGLTWACSEAGNIRSILLLTCAIICGYIYQCPPFRLSYQGLGEPLCFSAFGPFATTAFYLLQSRKSEMLLLPISSTVLSASVLVGFTTSLILLCSHFHQVDGDLAVGKMSPLVRIGTKAGARLVKVSITILYVLLFTLGLSRYLPMPCIVLCALTMPVGIFISQFVEKNHNGKDKIFMAKYYCVRLHALFGIALSIGLVAARTVAKP